MNFKDAQLEVLAEIASAHHARINAMHVSTGYELTKDQIENKADLELMCKAASFLFHQSKPMDVTEAINSFQVKSKINLLAMINNKHSFFENIFFQSKLNQIGFHLNIPFLVMQSAKN